MDQNHGVDQVQQQEDCQGDRHIADPHINQLSHVQVAGDLRGCVRIRDGVYTRQIKLLTALRAAIDSQTAQHVPTAFACRIMLITLAVIIDDGLELGINFASLVCTAMPTGVQMMVDHLAAIETLPVGWLGHGSGIH